MKYIIFDKIVYINGKSGIFSFNENDFKDKILKNTINFDEINIKFSNYNPSFATFCINISNACNLKCDYCFNKLKNGNSILLNNAIEFLETCFNAFPNKEKYYIDLSGKGEPLLFLEKILEIKKYCDKKSNELKREVLVQLVCNGTMLDPLTVKILQTNGILFGVSLDGNVDIHNLHRKTKTNNNTFETILNNVKMIPNHEYVGAACTLTNDVFSLKNSLVNLSKIFKTISYKPCRNCEYSINNKSIKKWLEIYDELTLFLTNETIKGNNEYIKTLLNGEDYFGKFIKRIILGQRTLIRCDAGLSRVTLDDDGKIYACPASLNMSKFTIGAKNKIETSSMTKLFEKQLDKSECKLCDFRSFCGGECQIEKELSHGINKIMCEYKKHLILLSMYFLNELANKNKGEYKKIYDFCTEIENRKKIDLELNEYLNNHPNLSFVEGKKIYDQIKKRY